MSAPGNRAQEAGGGPGGGDPGGRTRDALQRRNPSVPTIAKGIVSMVMMLT